MLCLGLLKITFMLLRITSIMQNANRLGDKATNLIASLRYALWDRLSRPHGSRYRLSCRVTEHRDAPEVLSDAERTILHDSRSRSPSETATPTAQPTAVASVKLNSRIRVAASVSS